MSKLLSFFAFTVSFFAFTITIFATHNSAKPHLSIANIQLKKESKKKVTLLYDAINTGWIAVALSPKFDRSNIIIDFDESFTESPLAVYQEDIIAHLFSKKRSIEPGKTLANIKMTTLKKIANSASAFRTNATNNSYLETDLCPDLVLDTAYATKRSSRTIQLDALLHNIGTAPAACWGKTDNLEDNLSIVAYLSATPTLSKSAVAIDGIFIDKEIKNQSGVLPEKRTILLNLKLNLESKTSLTNYLILTIDPLQTIRECNKTNNSYVFRLSQ